MNYVKKMCILRQIKQGFSGDGKPLSGLIKIEQYGKNLAVEVSVINFAPLALGEYYCLLSDGRGKTEMLSLRGKSVFNLLSDIDISGGFCGIVCYVKDEVVPVAYGINGNGSYDWRAILNKALPPVFPTKRKKEGELATATLAEPVPESTPPPPAQIMQSADQNQSAVSRETNSPPVEEQGKSYDDEAVATVNYYEEKERERFQSNQAYENANYQDAGQAKDPQTGADSAQNVDATRVRPAPDGEVYYLSVKRELDGLFSRYPQDKTLCKAFAYSEWARLRGTADDPQYLVGAVYENGRVKYLCYALAAKEPDNPPEEIRGVCSFVPVSPLLGAKGFFVLFQSAASGECVKPTK